jgi:NTE family protein
MSAQAPRIFDGLDDLSFTRVRETFHDRWFDPGDTLIAQGDRLSLVYLIESGTAEVVVTGRDGVERPVRRVTSGEIVGEISLVTRQPTVATVRAITPLHAKVLTHDALRDLADVYPVIYHNLSAIVAFRLAATNSTLSRGRDSAVVLLDDAAPPLLAFALAGAIAWHTHQATLLLDLAGGPAPSRFTRGLTGSVWDRPQGAGRAYWRPVALGDPAVAEVLDGRMGSFAAGFGHVLLRWPDPIGPPGWQARRIHLTGVGAPSFGTSEQVAADTRVVGWVAPDPRVGPDRNGVLKVPAPAGSEEGQLERGLLPPAGPAGRVLGWLARDIAGCKVGFAFGGGAARGYAHLGALKALRRAGIEADYVVGTSIGAPVEAMYSLGYDVDRMIEAIDRVGTSVGLRLRIPASSLLSSSQLAKGIRAEVGDTLVEDLRVPFAATAADLVSGREVQLSEGPLWRAVMASMSIPGVFPPQRAGDRVLVDGGLLNPVPSRVARGMGADVVIAVRLPGLSDGPAAGSPARWSAAGVLKRSIEMMRTRMASDSASGATILIEPDLRYAVSIVRFTEGRQFVAAGEAAVRAALPRIESILPWAEQVTDT